MSTTKKESIEIRGLRMHTKVNTKPQSVCKSTVSKGRRRIGCLATASVLNQSKIFMKTYPMKQTKAGKVDKNNPN